MSLYFEKEIKGETFICSTATPVWRHIIGKVYLKYGTKTSPAEMAYCQSLPAVLL